MVDHARLLEVLARFAQTLVRGYDIDGELAQLCADVADLLPVDGAGVMLQDQEGDLRFVAASDDHIGRIEQLQVVTGEGPCVTAHQTGEAVLIDDLATLDWLPEFAPRARETGIRAVYSFPMHVDDARIGALNLYRMHPGGLTCDAVAAAQLLADIATAYLVSADAVERADRLAAQLQEALDSRVVIEQAKGRLSGEWHVGTGEAFERMRRHARNNQRSLRAVAGDVVEGRLPGEQIDAEAHEVRR